MTVGELALKRKYSQDLYEDYCAEIMWDLNNTGQFFDGTTTWKVKRVAPHWKNTELVKDLNDAQIEAVVESMGFILR